MDASRLAIVVGLLLIPLSGRSAEAAPLLTAAFETQLETWLGQGDLTFNNLYTRASGDTASDFHTAADGQGATFTLFTALVGGTGTPFVVGGYNPQSWSSNGAYSLTPLDSQRTAFIYNLTMGTRQTQRTTSDPSPLLGQYQTFNDPTFGPSFGGGFDLGIDFGGGHDYAYQYSYGVGSGCADGGGGANIFGLVAGCLTPTHYTVGDLEVYTYTPVPEPSSLLFLATGAGLALLRRRRRGSAREH